MVEKTGETSQGTGAPGDQPGESEPGTIEASGDAIIVADALGGIATALDRLAAAVERLAAPEEDEEENPRRYLDGSIIPR